MHEGLAGWENFYVIVGSSGAALIGLQFVVIALVNDTRGRSQRTEGSPRTISAFGTPTVVHLAGALVISAVMSAPWGSLVPLAVALTICGLIGLSYGVIVHRHARAQTEYRPVAEDWLWHIILPDVAYAAVAIAAVMLRSTTHASGFVIGGAALALLLIAIHNAWDTVTYLVVGGSTPPAP
jgi:hypothetical protein